MDLLDDEVDDILKVSEGRWQIEECFRIMKTDFSADLVMSSDIMNCFDKHKTETSTTTYGKGIVQELFSFEDDTMIKITTAEYFTMPVRV